MPPTPTAIIAPPALPPPPAASSKAPSRPGHRRVKTEGASASLSGVFRAARKAVTGSAASGADGAVGAAPAAAAPHLAPHHELPPTLGAWRAQHGASSSSRAGSLEEVVSSRAASLPSSRRSALGAGGGRPRGGNGDGGHSAGDSARPLSSRFSESAHRAPLPPPPLPPDEWAKVRRAL